MGPPRNRKVWGSCEATAGGSHCARMSKLGRIRDPHTRCASDYKLKFNPILHLRWGDPNLAHQVFLGYYTQTKYASYLEDG